jgi:hypothetical protein
MRSFTETETLFVQSFPVASCPRILSSAHKFYESLQNQLNSLIPCYLRLDYWQRITHEKCGESIDRECKRCGNEILPSELACAPYCGYCEHLMSKDN